MDTRGGKRKGAGRKPVDGETRTEVIMVRLKKSEMEKFDAKRRAAARGVAARKLILAWLGLAALLMVGCSSAPPPSSEDLRKATAVVWFGSYEAPWDWEPPTVEIVDHKCLSAEETDRFSYAGCVDGFFHENENRISIGWWADSLHRSSLPHELWHAHEWKMHHDGDAAHAGRGWVTAVPEAEHDLAGEGL